MVRNILILVVMCVLGYLGYTAYQSHTQRASLNNGDYTCQDCDTPEEHARFLKENAGETADGDSERKTTTARHAAEDAAAGTPETPKTFGQDAPSGTSAMVDPSQAQAPVVVPTTQSPGAMVAGGSRHGDADVGYGRAESAERHDVCRQGDLPVVSAGEPDLARGYDERPLVHHLRHDGRVAEGDCDEPRMR